MKNKKSIILALVTVLLFSFAAMGCGDKASPKESAQILWNATLKSDVSGIKKLGGKDEDGQKLLDATKQLQIQSLKTTLTASGLKATDEQVESVCDAIMEACARNTVTIEETSKSGDSAEVKMTSTYIDEIAIVKKASDDAIDEIKKSEIKDKNELLNKATELYINNLVDGLKKAEISTETIDKTFNFKKDKDGYWIPESASDFSLGIAKMATNQI